MCMRPLGHMQALHLVGEKQKRACSLLNATCCGQATPASLMHGIMQALLDDAAPAAALGAVFALCRRLCTLIQVRHGP